jgi:hypothetical protein
VSEFAGGEGLSLGGDDLGALLAFCLGLAGHGPLHALGNRLTLHRRLSGVGIYNLIGGAAQGWK